MLQKLITEFLELKTFANELIDCYLLVSSINSANLSCNK